MGQAANLSERELLPVLQPEPILPGDLHPLDAASDREDQVRHKGARGLSAPETPDVVRQGAGAQGGGGPETTAGVRPEGPGQPRDPTNPATDGPTKLALRSAGGVCLQFHDAMRD